MSTNCISDLTEVVLKYIEINKITLVCVKYRQAYQNMPFTIDGYLSTIFAYVMRSEFRRTQQQKTKNNAD